jgi:DNA invertase Pin-like site-specific DNA recombinase
MGRKRGYARVSTGDQSADAQLTALRAAGCTDLYVETISGAKRTRPELERLLRDVHAGDTVVVTRLDRLARSLIHLLDVIATLESRGAAFQSLNDPIDTASAQGKLQLQILGAVAEFERALIRERTRAGLAEAARQGRKPGNPMLTRGSDATKALMALRRNAPRVERAIAEMPAILPVIRKLRPGQSWDRVCGELAARKIVRADGRPWTRDALLRTMRQLIREGLIDPDEARRLMRPAPRRAAAARQQRQRLVETVAVIFNTLPQQDRTLASIGAELERNRVLSLTGGSRWAASSVASLLNTAEERGMLDGERQQRRAATSAS